ncbi:hypothetical protein AAVH_43141, partial [Aphelenchoides avenae]
QHPQTASGKKDNSPPNGDLQLWCNIDDDDLQHNPYIQPARSASKKRKPWSGDSQFSSLLTAESAATNTAPSTTATAAETRSSARFGSLPIAKTIEEETQPTPKDPGHRDSTYAERTGHRTEATTDSTSSLLIGDRGGNSQTDEAEAPQIVVSKQQNKAAALSKIYARQQINKPHEQLLSKLNRQRQSTKQSQLEAGDAVRICAVFLSS